jgi:hypothetical protein
MNFALALIPAPYRILAIALLAVALVGFGFVKGVQHESAKADVRQAAQEKAALQAHLAATQRGLDIMSDALVLEGVKNEQLALVDRRLNAALGELRKRPDRPAPGAPPRDTAACAGATGAELAGGDAEFLTRYAADAARLQAAVETCQARYESVRQHLNSVSGK